MAFQSHRTRFRGSLAGISQEEIFKLDYTKENSNDRLEALNKKYSYMSKYHEEYTSEYYKVNLNSKDNLSCDINIFKALERDGSYLLNSLDIPRDSQQKYKFYTKEEFDKIQHKERMNIPLDNPEVLNIVKPDFKNQYKSNDLTINKSDFDDELIGEILNQYESFREYLREEMIKVKNKEGSKYDLGFIKRNLGSLLGDMIDTKRMMKVVLRPASKLGDIGSRPDFNSIRYSNPAHVKAIINNIRFGEIEPDNELSHIAYDIANARDELYQRGSLDKIDLEIIEGINIGISMRKLEEELGISNQAISKRFNKICEKIALYYTYLELVELE